MKRLYAVLIFLLAFDVIYGQTPQYYNAVGTSGSSIFLSSTSAFKTQLWYNPGDFPVTPLGNSSINVIYFRNSSAAATGTYTNFEVSMKQPAAGTGFGSTTFQTGLTSVLISSSQVLTGNSSAGGWFAIPLTTPFPYDNTKPLVCEVKFTAKTGGISTYATNATSSGQIKKLYASSPTATTGTDHTNFWQDFGFDLSAPLAIDFTDFFAANIGKRNKIGWITGSKTSTCVFDLQRSLNGVDYTTFVCTTGSAVSRAYSFCDEAPAGGKNYYRLRMTDRFGGRTYSSAICVNVGNSSRFNMNVFPNPATDQISVLISDEAEEWGSIEILDLSGNVIKTISVLGRMTDIDLRALSHGVYFIKYIGGLQEKTVSIFKQ